MKSTLLSRTFLGISIAAALLAIGAWSLTALDWRNHVAAAAEVPTRVVDIPPIAVAVEEEVVGPETGLTTVAGSEADATGTKDDGLLVVAGETATTTTPPPVDEVAEAVKAYNAADYRAARDLLASHLDQPAAALTYMRAGFQLGEVEPHDIELLRSLADHKNAAAARMLGDLYRAGKNVPESREQAETFYTLAISLGDRRSLLRLAQFYDEGGDTGRAIPAYANALADFPDKEPRYLYLLAASSQTETSVRTTAAARLDHLAATDLGAARAAFALYRKYQVPGVSNNNKIAAAAETAFALGAHELGIYLASTCTKCDPEQIEGFVRQSTSFNDAGRAAQALGRLAVAGKSSDVIAVLDGLPAERSVAIGAPLVRRLGAVSNAAIGLTQIRLLKAGLYDGQVDGLLGPRTMRALKRAAAVAGGSLSPTSPELIAWVVSHPEVCDPTKSGTGASSCAE